MASLDDELLQDAQEDASIVAFMKQNVPEEVTKKFSDDDLYYFLDTLVEYYANSNVLDATPNKEGFIEIDTLSIAKYLVQKAKEEKIGTFNVEDVSYLVEAELTYSQDSFNN